MAARSKNTPMCIVTFGYRHFLMPVVSGMKLVQLLGESVECESNYEGGGELTYEIGDPVKVEFVTVRPSQLRMPPGPSEPRRLEHR